MIFTDECHRSIYHLWRQVLEYFDAHLIGLTATPSKQTLGFFNGNLVMEYPRTRAVADGVNVDGQVYRIRTQITERGSTVDAGYFVDKRDRLTRAVRWEQLDEDFAYTGTQLDRDVVVREPDPHRDPHVPRQALHRPLPRPDGGPQDAGLRQGRQPRRGHRAHHPGGVRQGERVLPEDHLPRDGRGRRRPDRRVPQLLPPAHRGHRGHDLHRHRHQAAGGACSSCGR